MNIILSLFLLFNFGLIGLVKSSDVKFPSFDSKSLEVSQSNRKLPDGPFCKSIVAYFVGTLQNKNAPEQSHNVQFQLKLWVNDKDDKVHVEMEHWNEEYSNSKNFELDFYYDGNRQRCKIHDENCVSSLAKKTANFTLDLNTKSGNYYHLLNFNYFNNSFGLNDSRDKCTKYQLNNLNDNYVPNSLNTRLNYCVCCDSYNPSDILGCPCSKWNNKEPQKTTTRKGKPTTTPQPIPHNQTCQKIIGYYVGTFQNPKDHLARFDAQFQFKMDSNLQDKTFYYGITHWNQSYLDGNDDGLWINIDDFDVNGENIGRYDCWTPNTNCSAPFKSSTVYRYIALAKSQKPYWFNILQFPSFNNTFTLKNTIGRCTKYQPYLTDYGQLPDPSLFFYCVCCDTYNPHPSLNCPPNPWQGL